MMFNNLIWIWGHPEVYILVLPAFGVFSEVFSTYSGKPLFGYRSMVAATMVICVLSFIGVAASFLHHGGGRRRQRRLRHHVDDHRGPDRGEGLQLDVHHVRRPRALYDSPMHWAIGFIITFIIGGLTGVLLAVPPADFVLHNSLFLVAHFHNVIIGACPVRRFRRLHLLVPQGVRLPPGRAAWQSGVLVLVLRLLPRLQAALCRGPHGHDAAHAALRQSGVASLAARRGRRRRLSSWPASCVRSRNSSSASAIARSCAIRPAIRGTAGRSNGRRRRRRRLQLRGLASCRGRGTPIG